MRTYSLKGINRIPAIFSILVLLSICAKNPLAAAPIEEIKKRLAPRADFTEADFLKLEKGEMISKQLPSKDKREVAVLGIIQVKIPLDAGLKAFQESTARQNKKSIIGYGDFTKPPAIEDFKKLTLDKSDIENLKTCKVNDCGLKLSAEMIERFQTEIDWNAPDHSTRATLLFQKMLLEYIEAYISKGDDALIKYSDQRKPINLKEETRSLLDGLLWINDFAPEFSKYLADYPRSELSGATRTISWAKLNFGLKPVIIITETITYSKDEGGISQILSISKQIYATRYFDSSMALTALVKFPESEGGVDSFLIYTNHSRSSSLGGLFSKFKRAIVEQEAIDKLKPLLQGARLSSTPEPAKRNEDADPPFEERSIDVILSETYWIWIPSLLIAIAALFWIGRRIAKRPGP